MLGQKLNSEPEMVAPLEQKTLLIVDDEPVIRQLCTKALTGYRVIQAGDGLEALSILENNEIDIILSDVRMPKLDGLALLQRVKQEMPDQAVILMTGYSEKETILRALKEGADDFISKPINLLQLRTTVGKVLDKLLLRQELAELKQMDKLKSDFLGLISHKLKTPATAISLFVQNIADGASTPGEDGFADILTLVQRESLHLEHLIQDLLYFSKVILEDTQVQAEPLELGRITRQIATTLHPAASSQKVDYQILLDPDLPKEPLLLDRHRITFTIRALLDNAIKFTPAGGTVQLSSRVENQQILLEVKDSGIGIAEQELPKIFNKFYQIDPENTGQIRGFGLGLYYARNFARSMGGKLTLESQPQLGTLATLSFPLSND